MDQKTFNKTTGVIFAVVTIVHLLRALNGWDVNIGDFALPMWTSWVTVVVAGTLSYHGLGRR